MKKTLFVLTALAAFSGFAFANGGGDDGPEPVTWVWYPNESTPELAESRAEILAIVEGALGRPVREQLTTDYAIAIEALVNENAALSWFGGEGYTQAHEREPAILPLVVNSGKSGTLEDAKYYSMLGCLAENAEEYMVGGEYDLDTLEGRRFSFVSNSSTSGFRVPSSIISANFGVEAEDLLEGGAGQVFSEVMFGGSHQGSFFNVLTGKADIGAFCNSCINDYIEWAGGDAGYQDPAPGDVITVRRDAAAPFDQVPGVDVVLVATVPVLNAPLVVNTKMLTEEEVDALRAAFLSDEVTNNPRIFVPADSDFMGMFRQGQRFLAVEDEWYDPIRILSGLL